MKLALAGVVLVAACKGQPYQRALLGRSGDAGQHVEERASFDEQARLEAHLSVEDVEKIETMVAALASRRMSARMTGVEEAIPLPPAQREKPPPEQAEQSAKALAARQALLKSSRSLEDERARYGSQNIDVLLLREDQLLELWARMMGLPLFGKDAGR